jgi:hypothetical protein
MTNRKALLLGCSPSEVVKKEETPVCAIAILKRYNEGVI